MSKFSVKKPLTVFVAVIAVLVLGVVAFMRMTPDLLPNMDFPYIMIMTTYPGASPEKVEAEITKPMEQSMSTLEHIREVSSTSAENYSMVLLEFEESVNMDTIGVDIQQNIAVISSAWEDTVGTPYVLKINPSVLPVEVAALSYEGKDTAELTDFLNDTLMNRLEGVPGVARISTTGAVERQLHVVLDQELIDACNSKIAAAINGQLDDAAGELTEKKEELEEAQDKLTGAKAQLSAGQAQLAEKTSQAEAELRDKQSELQSAQAELQSQLSQLESTRPQVEAALEVLKALRSGLQEVDRQEASLREEVKVLREICDTYPVLQAEKAEYDRQIEAIEADETLTEEERAEKIAQIQTSEGYISVCASLSTMDAQLAARGLTLEEAALRVTVLEESLDAFAAQRERLEEALAQQGLSRDALDGKIAELEENLKIGRAHV